MKFAIKMLYPRIYLLEFYTQYDLCMSMVRMQEFYENIDFKNKVFSLEEFMCYWAFNYGHGCFNYTKKCKGFNLPGKVIDKFVKKYNKKFSLRQIEIDIVASINNRLKKSKENIALKDIYVIAMTNKAKLDVVEHEVAHAFYFLYPQYRKSCKLLLKKINTKRTKALLLSHSYHKSVLDDEMQAYFSTSIKKDILKSHVDFVYNFNMFKNQLVDS